MKFDERFDEVLRKYKRVAIVGGPKTGKTTLASRVTDRKVIHTDEAKERPWEEQPEIIKSAVAGNESFVVEGVQAARALRKGLEVDCVVYLEEPKEARTKRQAGMGKGVGTVLKDYLDSTPDHPPVVRLDGEGGGGGEE